MNNKTILVTGSAGFIGFHVCKKLLESDNIQVIGIDNFNNYYDIKLKYDRIKLFDKKTNFINYKNDISDKKSIDYIFNIYKPQIVINLAAQAGVRYSLINPYEYINSNIIGFMNILEACKNSENLEHLIYASSSSVYGANFKIPFSVEDNIDHPINMYAVTKKTNELMSHSYSFLYNLPTTGLRFFTVYGPYGRPDMALFKFTKAIIEDQPIEVYNFGLMKRDFTYIDDIVEGIIKLIPIIPKEDRECNNPKCTTKCRVYNIGNNDPIELEYFISLIENNLNKKAKRLNLPMQPGDIKSTYADIEDLERSIGFRPKTKIEDGVKKFIDWYLEYYNIKL